MPGNLRRSKKADARAVFVDTSGWIAFFSLDDRNHARADRLVSGAIAKGKFLITSNLVLAEVHRLLLFRAGIRAAAFALDKIATSPSVELVLATPELHRQARVWLDKLGDQVITLTDAVSFAVMVDTRCRAALTFDRDFWIAGFERFELA